MGRITESRVPRELAQAQGLSPLNSASLCPGLQLTAFGEHHCSALDSLLLSCTVSLCLAEEAAVEDTGPLKVHSPLYTA